MSTPIMVSRIPAGSPNINYEYGAYHMESDGNVDLSNWSIDYSYGWNSPIHYGSGACSVDLNGYVSTSNIDYSYGLSERH